MLPVGSDFSFKTIRAQFPLKSNPDISDGAVSGFLNILAKEKLILNKMNGTDYIKDGRAFVYKTTAFLKRDQRQFNVKPVSTSRERSPGYRNVIKTTKIAPDLFIVEYEGARNKLGVLAAVLERKNEELLNLCSELATIGSEMSDLYLQLNDKVEINLTRIPIGVLFKHLKMRRERGLVNDADMKDLYDIDSKIASAMKKKVSIPAKKKK